MSTGRPRCRPAELGWRRFIANASVALLLLDIGPIRMAIRLWPMRWLHRETSMMEDCATSMSAQHGCTDDMAVVENLKEALKQRVGAERYQMWFANGVKFDFDSAGAQRIDDSGPVSDDDASDDDASDDDASDDDASDDDAQRGATSRHAASADETLPGVVMVRVRGQFALDRLRKNFLRELRGAVMQVCGSLTDVELCLDQPLAEQVDLPLGDGHDSDQARPSGRPKKANRGKLSRDGETSDQTGRRSSPRRRGNAKPISNLIANGAAKLPSSGRAAKRTKKPWADRKRSSAAAASNLKQLDLLSEAGRESPPSSEMTVSSLVLGPSNQLAHTAMAMVSQEPSTASPLFLSGPTGTGKTHILSAIADQLRRRHRMRRVMHLSAEQFTNDFISSVGNSGITSFRRRYREVDALLIDDVQFLGAKQATLRELLYTVETLAGAGRPLVFSGLQTPTEIPGLSRELAGRMAAGLVCPIQPIDMLTREVIFRRWLQERCSIEVPESMIEQINSILSGDGRVISGVVNLINTLQRMLGRMPSMEELRRFGGELLRAVKPVATLSVIEMAVCEAFHLSQDTLRGGSQTRAVSQPRMLAMYLSRQLTSSAYTEIARHFGGKSHSTAISAENNVKSWLAEGKSIGRGHAAMSAQEAIDRVESLLRSG